MTNIFTVQILLTDKCNLNCIYCYEQHSSKRTISVELAKKIVVESFEMACINRIDYLVFYFHGGEICLEFELLFEICEWLWANKWPVAYHCSAATNGTLVHNQIANWFTQNAYRFSLGLSLDGSRDMHNLNRCQSYDLIDLNLWKRFWPNDPVKMTISPVTVYGVSNAIIDLINNGFKVTANASYGMDWQDEDIISRYAHELHILSLFFLNNPDIMPTGKILNKRILKLGIYHDRNYCSCSLDCGVGKYMYCYDINGEKVPCQMFLTKTKHAAIPTEFDEKDILIHCDCMKCSLINVCSTCLGYNYIQYGRLIKGPIGLCKVIKTEYREFATMLNLMLKKREKYVLTRNLNEEKIGYYLKAINNIMENL